MNYLEQVEENKKAIKAEIIEYVALECIRNSKGIANYYYEVEFRLNNELSISKEVNDRNNYLDFLNKKLEEVFRSNNPLTHKWRVINYPLLTTLEKEYNLFFEFDSILKIKRGTKKKDNKGGFMNIPSYYNYEIIDYLEGMKPLLNKDNELKEIDVIEFLCNHYHIYSDAKYYESEEFHKNMKDDIKEFLFTYIDYILYSKYKADYINSKQSNNIEEKQIPQPNPNNLKPIGKLSAEETHKLYQACNNIVFKYCTLENFVNSLNNPQECNLEVKKNSLLYVLYSWFYNIFDDNIEERIKQLNEMFGITEDTYRKKKPLSNKTQPQDDLETSLQAVWDVN